MAAVKGRRGIKHEPHQRFKGYLAENDIRQGKVAELLNISRVTLNQKLNGYLHFKFDEVEKICREYDITPDIFLTYKLHKYNT